MKRGQKSAIRSQRSDRGQRTNPEQRIKAGGMILYRTSDNTFWLGGPGHEPMATTEAKIEKLLKAFHRREF